MTSAQSQLTSANADLANATLTSTIAGTVASVSLTVGQQVSSGGSGSGGTGSTGSGSTGTGSSGTGTGSTGTGSTGSSSSAQVVVIGTNSFVVNGTVDDTEVGDVKAGDQAVITPTGATTPVYGTVSSVGIIASQSSGVATFPVVIKVTGTPANLYAGSTADVSIIVKELYDVVEVPTAAISYSGGNAQVTTVVNGAHVTKDITVGESSGGETQVTSGLKVGDKVVERIVTFTGGATGGVRGCSVGPAPAGSVAAPEGSAGAARSRAAAARSPAGAAAGSPVADAAPPVIGLEHVTKVYRTGSLAVAALRGVSMTIDEGEYVAIMGPSGSGKSTLMHILGCLDVPSGGTYRLAGEDVSGMTEAALASVRNRRIGFVFQQFNLLASMPAWRNVELPLAYAGVGRTERRQRALAALARVGLGDRVDHRPGELSGGQQQRVAIARALVTDPDLILADEPTGNLDSTSAGDLMALMDELHAAGRTLVLITHDADVATAAERIVRIRDGLLVPAPEIAA